MFTCETTDTRGDKHIIESDNYTDAMLKSILERDDSLNVLPNQILRIWDDGKLIRNIHY